MADKVTRDNVEARLREAELRLTPQRFAVLEYLTRALEDYPPAEWRVKSLFIFFHVLTYIALSARTVVAARRIASSLSSEAWA